MHLKTTEEVKKFQKLAHSYRNRVCIHKKINLRQQQKPLGGSGLKEKINSTQRTELVWNRKQVQSHQGEQMDGQTAVPQP